MKHTKNIYFCYREVDTTLEYKILVNVDEKDKASVYADEAEGWNIQKILANE